MNLLNELEFNDTDQGEFQWSNEFEAGFRETSFCLQENEKIGLVLAMIVNECDY